MHSDGKFATVRHCSTGPDARGGLDGGRVDTAVDYAPRRVMLLGQIDVPTTLVPETSSSCNPAALTNPLAASRFNSVMSTPHLLGWISRLTFRLEIRAVKC